MNDNPYRAEVGEPVESPKPTWLRHWRLGIVALACLVWVLFYVLMMVES